MNILEILVHAALAAGVDPTLLQAVCWVETRHEPSAIAVVDGSSASYGLCQIKLATAKRFRKGVTPSQLLNPVVNAELAAQYLARQLRRYHGRVHCALQAYNGGTAKFCGRLDSRVTVKHTSYSSKVIAASKEKAWERQAGSQRKPAASQQRKRPNLSITERRSRTRRPAARLYA